MYLCIFTHVQYICKTIYKIYIYIKLDLDPCLYIKQKNGDPCFLKTHSASQPPKIQFSQQDK